MEEWAFACCVLLRFVQTLIWRLQLFPFCGYTTVSLLRTKTCHSQTRRWVLVLRSLVLRSLVLLALVLRSLVLRILVLRSLVLRILVLRIRLRVRCNTAFWSAPVRVLVTLLGSMRLAAVLLPLALAGLVDIKRSDAGATDHAQATANHSTAKEEREAKQGPGEKSTEKNEKENPGPGWYARPRRGRPARQPLFLARAFAHVRDKHHGNSQDILFSYSGEASG